MRHFLERLASSVTKPATTSGSQPALRPLLGSIYAPAWADRAAVVPSSLQPEKMETSIDGQYENTARTTRMSRTTREEQRSEPLESNLQAARAESEASRSQHSAGASLPEISSRRKALLPAASAEAQGIEVATPLPAGSRDAVLAHNDQESALRMQREDAALRSDLNSVIDRLMRPSQPEAPSIARSVVSQSASGRARTESRESMRRAGQATREPAEITINIGRIEVTAVPQPAVRPAAVPARRSVSLDEYLKRGNGRAR